MSTIKDIKDFEKEKINRLIFQFFDYLIDIENPNSFLIENIYDILYYVHYYDSYDWVYKQCFKMLVKILIANEKSNGKLMPFDKNIWEQIGIMNYSFEHN